MNAMKMNDKLFDYLAGFIFIFVLNLFVSSLCMFFLDMKFRECIIYSAFNGILVPFLIPLLRDRFKIFK